MNTNNPLKKATEYGPDSFAPIVRESLIILALIAFMGIAMFLPGIDMELPGTDISVGDVVIAAGSVGIVASLIWLGPELREFVRQALEGPSSLIGDCGSIVRNLALFVAVLVAHWGFAGVLRPLLEVGWAYDAGFLLLALIPLGIVAYRAYSSLDPMTDFVTDWLLDRQSGRTESASDGWT